MKYEFKIEGLDNESGTIDLDKLGDLAKNFQRLAELAAVQRLTGFSITKLNKKPNFGLSLTGLKKGSTILEIEAPSLAESLKQGQFQTNMFGHLDDIETQSPVSLAVGVLANATSDNVNTEMLDADLIKPIKRLKKVFTKNVALLISNEGGFETLRLDRQALEKVDKIEQATPKPKKEIVSGELEVLDFSKEQVKIKTRQGQITGKLKNKDTELLNQARQLGGHKVAAEGVAHFKPSGQLWYLLIEKLHRATEKDRIFDRKPSATALEQSINSQLTQKSPNPLAQIVGNWPGDETDEEFEQMIKHLD